MATRQAYSEPRVEEIVTRFPLGHFVATQSMKERVLQVLESGRLSYGPVSRQFEQEFARIHDNDYAVLSNSGTSSLVVALQAMKELHGWSDGDEVIVPSCTFVATINAVLHNRLRPVLVDVDARHYDLDVARIERAITPRTRCILPVSLFGYPCDLLAVLEIANRHDLLTLHDSCETMFADVGTLSAGHYADISCYSLYMAHTLAAGVGGIALCHAPEWAEKMRSLVNHGIALDELPVGEPYEPTFLARRFTFDAVGHSYRITELEAAIALEQLQGWRSIRDRRGDVARRIEEVLRPYADHLQLATCRPDTRPCPMVYPLVLKREAKYNLMRHLRLHGIECRDLLPLINQPCYKGLWKPADYPVARRLLDTGLYIGCCPHMRLEDVTYVGEVFGEYFRRHAG